MGECRTNPDYMLPNCEKACYVCSGKQLFTISYFSHPSEGQEVQDVKIDSRLFTLDALASRFPDINEGTEVVAKRLLGELKEQLQGEDKREVHKEKFAVGMQGDMFLSIIHGIVENGPSYVKKEVR